MFADRESALAACMCLRACGVCVCYMCECVCPGEEYALAAQVSRSQCEAEVHNGFKLITGEPRTSSTALGTGRRWYLRTTPVQKSLKGGLCAAGGEVGSFMMLHMYYSTSVCLDDSGRRRFCSFCEGCEPFGPWTSGFAWIGSVTAPFPVRYSHAAEIQPLFLAPPHFAVQH